MARRVADTVGRGAVPAAGEPLEHVAEVAHDGTRRRGHVDPAAVDGAHLESAEPVLGEQCQQAVVGVFAHPPRLGARVGGDGIVGRVVEDAEQDRRVAGEVLLEPVAGESQAERDRSHHGVGHRSQRVEPVLDRTA